MSVSIVIKRAYEDPSPADGYRVLVDRIWPRGKRREALALDQWAKELGPSTVLRQWFGHDPQRWEEFRERYRRELDTPQVRELLASLLHSAGRGPLTLVYSARDEQHNQAIVLRELLLSLQQPEPAK